MSEFGDGRMPARFWSKVQPNEAGCWEWTGCVHRKGYGMFLHNGTATAAHRVAYESLVGEIGAGLVLDHRCHDPEVCTLDTECPHRRCVNPDHVQPITAKANSSAGRRANRNRRKTHCDKGHPFNDENTYYDEKSNRRACKICRRERWRKYDRKRRHKVPS